MALRLYFMYFSMAPDKQVKMIILSYIVDLCFA